MSSFLFLRPMFLWFLPLLVVVYLLYQKKKALSSTWENVCDAPLLKYLLATRQSSQKWRTFWAGLGFLAAVIALSGPSFNQKMMPSVKKQTPLMLVLDLSSDMNRTDLRPSRLARAKMEIGNIFEKSEISPSGLIVYTYEPFLISPLADDKKVVLNLMPAVQSDIMPLGGNKLDRAIDLAHTKLKEGEYEKGHILILTSDVPLDFNEALMKAKEAQKDGFKVSVYGLSLSENKKLKEIAKVGGGGYFDTSVISSQKLVDFLKTDLNADLQESKTMVSVPVDNGFILVFLVAFCVLLFFRKGALVVILTTFLSFEASAGFFFNNNQEGAILFKAKEFEKAASKFDNNAWKASAYYKSGNYPAAIDLFKNQEGVTALYNLGNALAKGGRIEEAIKVYEEVLEKEPNHEDAKFNLEYLKNMMQNEKQKQNSKNEKKEEDQNKNNQNNNQNQNEENEEKESQNSASASQTNEENDNEQDQKQNEQQSSVDETQDKSEENSDGKNENKNELEHDLSKEKQRIPQMPAKEEKADKYDETVQARVQRFREIKDDPGGLLKAFIKQEYLKKRYQN